MILKEEYWPADTRWILTDFLMSDEGAQRGSVTPRFILARNGKVVFTAVGNRGWKQEMWPEILEVTKTVL
jgi:hypothetical protein